MSINDFTAQPDLFSGLDRRPPRLPEDICRSRHKGSKTSEAANAKLDKAEARRLVLEAIQRRGGISYLHELCRDLNKPPNCVSPRLSEMKADGTLKETGERYEGCAQVQIVK